MAGKQTFGIKVSEIPDGVTEVDLQSLFSKFGNISSVHLKNSKPLNHAYINYDSQHSVVAAAEAMNGYSVSGGTIKVVSQNTGSGRHKSTIPESVQPKGTVTNADTNQFSIKISNINPSTTQEVLSGLFKTRVILKEVPGKKSFAYANYEIQEEMQDSLKLHGTSLDGLQISVKEATSSRSSSQNDNVTKEKSQMSVSLHRFFLSKMASNINELETKGGTVNWDSGFLYYTAPNSETLMRFKNNAVDCLFEDSLQLSVETWNKLMTTHPNGCSLFQQLTQPFRSNPNVEIHTDVVALKVILLGFKVAVQDAMQAVASALYNNIPIDGVKLLYTLKMFPNLQADLLKEFGITVQGFYPGSSELILSGNRPEPYLKITGILNHQNILMCTCIGLLIQSAQKRISLEKLPAVLCAHGQNKGDFCYAEVYSNSLSQITLLICGPDDVPQKVSTIINSPEQKEVILANANAIQVIKGLPQCNFVQLLHHYGVYIQENVHRPSLVVQGYVQEEVMAVFSILSGAATSVAASVNTVVPVLPSFTHTEKFQYHCHPNFKSQIQEHVVDTLQQQLRVAILFFDSDVMTQYSPAKPVSESGGKAKKVVITLLLQSNFEEDFSDACGKLKEIKPQCKYTTWSKKEYEVLSKKVKKQLKDFEKSNRVRIILHEKNSSVDIYGLTNAEVSASEYHLKNSVESNLVIESQISVSRYESLFLRKKHKSDLYELCKVRFPTGSDFQSDSTSASLVLEGSKTKVDLARQKVNEALNELQVKSVSFQHDSYGEMWKRKWFELKKQEEVAHNIVVNVHAILGEKTSKNPADVSLNVELAIIGKDSNSISEIESTITDIGIKLLRKTESISKAQLAAVKEGLKSKKLSLRENHNTEVVWNQEKLTIDLITPNGSSEELDAAYNLLMAYTEGVAVNTEKVHFRNVIGLFLQQHKQWQQIVTIAKQNSVTVKLVSNGITIRGKLGNTGNAKKSIEDKLQRLLELFAERKIKIDDMLLPILDTPGFEGIVAKVKQDHGCILTKCKAIQSIQVKKPDGSVLTIEICIGSIFDETSDAIVNVSSFNAQNSAIKELADAGGPTIQKEYDNYIAKHGAISLCKAICLGSGDLKCSKVIHVELPVCVNGSESELAKISESIQNSLVVAEKHSICSISIPSFHTDSSALSECAKALLQATLSLSTSGTLKCLEIVRFVLTTKEIANTYGQKLLELQGTTLGPVMINSDKLLTPTQSFIWFWENDFGCLEPYADEDSTTLSQQFSSVANCKIVVKGNMYTFEFAKMLQVNDQTSKSRRIEKRKLQPFWKYQNDKGQWDLYTEEQSQAIEAMWQTKQPSILQIGKWKYTFNFDSTPMTQINTTTNRSRTICRVDSKATQNINHTASEKTSLLLVGPKESLDKAEQAVQEFLKGNLDTEEISLTASQSSSVAHEIGKKYNVAVSDLPQSKVMLKGLNSNVMKAVVEIKLMSLQDYTKADKEIYPVEWEPQNDELELKQLGNGTPEWSKVSQQFRATLSSAMIIKIERVQNKWLWEKYFQHSERMKMKNGGVINEKMLFHGTRSTPPSSIYQDEEGFDMRFSNAGMWGTGNYFAVNASYSNGYAHHLSDGTKQMFLAKVLTGDSIQLQSTGSLRMPPVKNSSKGVVRYDTVTGHTNGSQVFIAYSNDKAYPFYLISYK